MPEIMFCLREWTHWQSGQRGRGSWEYFHFNYSAHKTFIWTRQKLETHLTLYIKFYTLFNVLSLLANSKRSWSTIRKQQRSWISFLCLSSKVDDVLLCLGGSIILKHSQSTEIILDICKHRVVANSTSSSNARLQLDKEKFCPQLMLATYQW